PQLRNRPSRAMRSTGRLAQAALAMAALALVVLGVLYVWSSQASFAVSSSHAAAGGKAIRLTAGSNNSGPRTLPGPVAPARADDQELRLP
ncbi:MAG TPA: hypothetical protein VNE82_14905, partial [Candidatus Binataceae bacterium]|nr:hypothetical protein [Candidatus Binataceae bacterium]